MPVKEIPALSLGLIGNLQKNNPRRLINGPVLCMVHLSRENGASRELLSE
jgi:hypothetical protein